MTELFGAILAILYLLLAMKEQRSCWVMYILSSILYFFVFWKAGLFLDSFLQIFFIVMGAYGFIYWKQQQGIQERPIVSHSIKTNLIFIIITGVITVLFGVYLKSITHSNLAYGDSFLTIFSILTTYLSARKVLENWLYWIVIDVIGTGIYLYKSLYITAGLFFLYSIMAWFGYCEWKKRIRTV